MRSNKSDNRRLLFAIFLIVFVDLLGFGLILPLLPFYAEDFNASDTVIGILVATYAAGQLFGAPMLGRLSDRYGRRPVLLVSIAGTLVGYLILGFAGALWMLFLSRIIDGITGGNISVARAYIADVTDEENRSKGMGLIGAAFGLGFVIGPAVGGALSGGDNYALPAFVAAALAAINLAAVYFWLPESLDDARRERLRTQPARHSLSVRSLRDALNRPRVGPLLQIWFVYMLAFVMFEGVFSIYAKERLGLASDETGYLLAYAGVIIVFVQGGVIGRLAARYADDQLILGGAALLTASLLAWAAAPNVIVVAVALAPLALATGVLSTVLQSALSKAASADEAGSIMGLSTGLGSVTRVIGPAAGGLLIDTLGAWSPGVVGAALSLWVLWYGWRYLAGDGLAPERAHSDLSRSET